ncbi:hypothetical protein PV327_009531 [Microctonus hyperodae]|uniref:Uncharacterized protein n=1 Tax=Microctonus hyperodae TaxID=165561 RepID=A0AA39EZS9_MICHY|nr:hypothetical protein PV327_009531 [Microctonus hyperodae]
MADVQDRYNPGVHEKAMVMTPDTLDRRIVARASARAYTPHCAAVTRDPETDPSPFLVIAHTQRQDYVCMDKQTLARANRHQDTKTRVVLSL